MCAHAPTAAIRQSRFVVLPPMSLPFRSFVIAAASLAPLASQQPTPSATPRIAVRIVDERGAQVAAHVMDYAVQGQSYSGRATAADGTLRVLAPRGHQWVVSTPQSRAVVLSDPRGDVEVRLQARADVTLRAPDGVDIPAGLHLHLRSREHSFVHGSELDLATAGERQWRIRPVLGGRMRVTLCAPSADGIEVEAWRGELTIGDDANAPIDLPIDAQTAAALPRPTAGK